ncbi:hypothetical protein KM043_007716 [Ampulex compressa]|nr:hypothetical protein KM043_007716 [Ampulex compressa]
METVQELSVNDAKSQRVMGEASNAEDAWNEKRSSEKRSPAQIGSCDYVEGDGDFTQGNHVDFGNWFIKPECEDGTQSFFDLVTVNYENPLPLMEEHPKKASKSTAVVCDECGKNFSRLDSLRRHEKQYCKVKGERMYCRFCGKKFVNPLSLIDHVKTVHVSDMIKTDGPQMP